MDDEARRTAYFRFGIISPLLSVGPDRTLAAGLEEQAAKTWTDPDGVPRTFAASTVEHWLYRYRSGGLDALVDPPRRDLGSFPGVPGPVAERALALLEDRPGLRTSVLRSRLAGEGLIVDGVPSRSTFYRWVKANRPPGSRAPQRERRAFEAPWSGALWQADIMYGPPVPRRDRAGRNRKAQTYLVAVIDDHSRLLCEGRFAFSQGMDAWLDVLRTACCRRGIPEKLYLDNGKVFTSPEIRRIGAVLGINVIHTAVRDAQAKGKIERFFRSVRTAFLEGLELEGIPAGIDALNRAFRAWVESYNRRVHSAHGMTPLDRWVEGASRIRTLDSDEAEELFLFETRRRVRRDGTFSLRGCRYETDAALAGEKVLVRYDPIRFVRVDVWFEDRFRGRAARLDLHANDGRPRDTGGER